MDRPGTGPRQWIKLHQQAKAGPVVTRLPTVGGYVDSWLRDVVEPNLAPATAANYDMFVRRYIAPDRLRAHHPTDPRLPPGGARRPPRVTMQILPHSQIAVTRNIYSEAASEATEKALKRLGEQFI